MRNVAPLLARALVLGLLALGPACSATSTYRPQPGPYDAVPREWSATLTQARETLERGDVRAAHDLVRPLAAQRPAILPVRIFLQELQVTLLERGESVGGFQVPDGADPALVLGDLYLQRADARPSTAEYVLAARLAPSGEEALRMLERAQEADATCVWTHYARAHWNARLRRFPEARAAVQAAFDRDPGHLPTMRLHASLLAGASETAEALAVLELWLARTRDDPMTDPTQRANADLDRAALLLLEDEPRRALRVLEDVDRMRVSIPERVDLLRAVALQDLDDRPRALSAARRAYDAAPDQLLPLVHQAMLLNQQGNFTQEEQIWRLLLQIIQERRQRAEEEPDAALDMADLLIQVRANTRLSRLREGRR